MRKLPKIFILALIIGLISLSAAKAASELIDNVELYPVNLDISRFAPYNLIAEITGSPTSVSTTITGLNSGNEVIWNYYANGNTYSEEITKTMSYDNDLGKYKSTDIYPDNIYPEIFFSPSSVTWNNLPLDVSIRRNNYHLMHFANSFNSAPNSSFFIELNAIAANSANSLDLDVYLVGKGKDITFFENADWRAKPGVELVGTFSKTATFHHTHTANSKHHLIALLTDDEGKIGNNSLDITGDFWVVLYSGTPLTNRGWYLRYQPTPLCTVTGRWYEGTQSGWNTTLRSGCPDVHIHMARRGLNSDGIRTEITALYSGSEPEVETTDFSFEPLPNLAPNISSFITPLPNGVYEGGTGPTEEIEISWNEGTDPNNDTLTYKIYYSPDNSSYTLIDTTDNTQLTWDISLVSNGSYYLKGQVCEKETSDLYCTDFYLPGTFDIEKTDPVYSLTGAISIVSSNTNTLVAKPGDTITLTYTSTGDISATQNILFYSGGLEVAGSANSSNNGNEWTITYTADSEDTDGILDFIISASNLDKNYSETTDNSYVQLYITGPNSPSASPASGTFSTTQTVTLSGDSEDTIKYTTNGDVPTCSTGTTYISAIAVSETTTVKAIACDPAGNYSETSIFNYVINTDDNENGDCEESEPRGTPNIYKVVVEKMKATVFINSVKNLTEYFLDYSESSTAKGTRKKFGPNPSDHQEYSIENLTPGTNYYVRVKAVNKCASGDWSEIIKFTTLSNLNSGQPTSNGNFFIKDIVIEGVKPAECSHIVKQGDTLWQISSIYYGSGNHYETIIESNEDVYPDIRGSLGIGWVLRFPCTVDAVPDKDFESTNTPNVTFHDVLIKVTSNSEPLAGAMVELYSKPRQGTTNSNGEIMFTNVESGEHTIIITYNSLSREEKINIDGKEKSYNISVDVHVGKETKARAIVIPAVVITSLLGLIFIVSRSRKFKTLLSRLKKAIAPLFKFVKFKLIKNIFLNKPKNRR